MVRRRRGYPGGHETRASGQDKNRTFFMTAAPRCSEDIAELGVGRALSSAVDEANAFRAAREKFCAHRQAARRLGA